MINSVWEENEKRITISIIGVLDVRSSDAANMEIRNALHKYSPEKLVVDLKELKYISSTGLRLLLSLKRDYKTMEVKNVTSQIFDIFYMMGFDEILNIEMPEDYVPRELSTSFVEV